MGVGYPGSASYGEEWKDYPPKTEKKFDTITTKEVVRDLIESDYPVHFEMDMLEGRPLLEGERIEILFPNNNVEEHRVEIKTQATDYKVRYDSYIEVEYDYNGMKREEKLFLTNLKAKRI
jgi:hypothetical protein